MGLLKKIENNKYKATDILITTEPEVLSASAQSFHQEMGLKAVESISRFDVNSRSFESLTVPMNKSSLDIAKKTVDKFITDIESIADRENSDTVYQMNVQIFPLVSFNEKN